METAHAEPITILDVLKAWMERDGRPVPADGSYNGSLFEEYRLPMLGGCVVCNATVAPYNACPSKTGFLCCKNGCIDDQGFKTVQEFDAWLKEHE